MKTHAILALFLALSPVASSPAARADSEVHVCTSCTTATVGEIVEHRMSAPVRDEFKDDMKTAGVDYDAVKDVEVTYDKEYGEYHVKGVSPEKHPEHWMIFLGAHIGALFPVGLDVIATVSPNSKPAWDFDASWEPSAYRQSYSVGAAYHPFHNMFFVGARFRWVQEHAPWSRGYDGRFDNEFGGGAEIGLRDRLWGSRFLGWISLGAFYVTNPYTSSAPILYTLNVGLAYGVAGNE
jgi:hypothetical protein